jgi:hypothetical protein
MPHYRLIALALAGLVSATALAAPNKKPEQDATPKTKAVDKPADSSVTETLIPELSFQGTQLEDAIDFLQDSIPNFKAMVIRDSGVAAEVPTIRMKLKKVSLDQFLELLTTAYPGVEVSPVSGAGGTVYVIKVHLTDQQWRNRHGLGGIDGLGGGGPGAAGVGGGGGGGASQPDVGVRVYALGQYINYVVAARAEVPKDKAAANKEALNQILSLIKAALAQVGDASAPQPVIQVHEETQTLIVKGNTEQHGVLEEALAQLMPRQSDADRKRQDEPRSTDVSTQREKASQQDRLAEMEKMLQSARKQLEERDKMASSQAAEIEHLRVRLEAMERAKNSNDPKPAAKSDKGDSPQQ